MNDRSIPRPTPNPHPPALLDNQIIENRFHDVWEAIDDLREKKQNKVGPMIWLPILLWLFTSSAGIIWGSASMVTKMENLTTAVGNLGTDRYYGRDATKDFALRDQAISTNSGAIDDLKDAILRIEAGITEINRKLAQ